MSDNLALIREGSPPALPAFAPLGGRWRRITTYAGIMPLDTILLLALPASGKSELRRYLASLDPATARSDFGLGPTVQLDDYPYVHLMRRISEELRAAGLPPAFFESDTHSMSDGRDWATLIHLLNEDYASLAGGWPPVGDPGEWLLERISGARARAGADPGFVPRGDRATIASRIRADAEQLVEERTQLRTAQDDTIVVEFARGGPAGAPLPLPPPHGYAFSLAALSDEILERASILYVWVTPEESRKRNRERARPGGDASILHHGVPEQVMFADYGCDDMDWLIDHSTTPGTVDVRGFQVPVARFDNRVDKTSFLREADWPPEKVADLHRELREVFGSLQSR